MKIGFILECSRDGPDQQVLETLIRRLRDQEGLIGKFDPVFICQNNKKLLIESIAPTVQDLLNDGCEHVFICWDAKPSWPTMGAKIDCKSEVHLVQSALESATIRASKYTLFCIKYELETWLISDPRAFGLLPHSNGATPGAKKPLQEFSPKNAASVMKSEVGLGPYLDYNDAKTLADNVQFRKLARVPSFCEWFCQLFSLAGSKPRAPFCNCATSTE